MVFLHERLGADIARLMTEGVRGSEATISQLIDLIIYD
jgi:hypothetical protein